MHVAVDRGVDCRAAIQHITHLFHQVPVRQPVRQQVFGERLDIRLERGKQVVENPVPEIWRGVLFRRFEYPVDEPFHRELDPVISRVLVLPVFGIPDLELHAPELSLEELRGPSLERPPSSKRIRHHHRPVRVKIPAGKLLV
jgi:hypothetical protein